jgi:hypothetical protein
MPKGLGPGMFIASEFLRLGDVDREALDQNKDRQVPFEEMANGFAKWFDAWNSDRSGFLTAERLRDGVNKDLVPADPPAGFGPPPGSSGRHDTMDDDWQALPPM